MNRNEQIAQACARERSVSEERAFTRGALWADRNPRWVSVEDELPHGGVYFFCRANGDVFIASDELGLDFYDDITHWMPLPKAPRKESEQ